jgi:hypothetical protein
MYLVLSAFTSSPISLVATTKASTKYYSDDQIKKNLMGGACSKYGGEERVLVMKPEGKRPLGRSRSRWEDNIKMDL